jgi:hypothetical protein
MPLLPEGTRFALLRHVVANPVHVAVIGLTLTMLALTAVLLLR